VHAMPLISNKPATLACLFVSDCLLVTVWSDSAVGELYGKKAQMFAF